MKPIKTAIVGFGVSGQCFHAPLIEYCEEFDFAAVVSSDSKKVKNQFANVIVYSDLETLLKDDSIELVVIATPNHLHVPQAKQALLAGKHVVIEKPFSISVQEGKELIAIAEQSKKCISVYHNRRYDGDFKTIEKLILDGKLTDIHTFYSNFNRFRPEVKVRWREQDILGAGILFDLGAHLIDQALCLFGSPQSVTAIIRNQRTNAQAVDHFHLILHYPDREAILHANCLSTTPGPRFQIFSSNASFTKYGMDTQEDLLRNKQNPNMPEWGQDDPKAFGIYTDQDGINTIIETEKGSYQSFYQQMAKAIRKGEKVPVTLKQALDVIIIIEAAYLSAKQQKTRKLIDNECHP